MTKNIKLNPNELTEKETMKMFLDGARKAASCAKELAAITENPEWIDIEEQITAIRDNGYTLSRMKAMTKTELEQGIGLKLNPTVN